MNFHGITIFKLKIRVYLTLFLQVDFELFKEFYCESDYHNLIIILRYKNHFNY